MAKAHETGYEAAVPPLDGSTRAAGRNTGSLAALPPNWRALEALVEKYRGRRFEELLRDPGFKRLSPTGVQALAAEYRRQTKRLRAESAQHGRSRRLARQGRRLDPPDLSAEGPVAGAAP